jgi:hypothetical protein
MIEILAHITPHDTPSLWLVGMAGFAAGVAVTYAVLAVRKLK